MKTQQQIIDTINRLASRKAGVNRREVRDHYQNDQRAEAMRVVGLMVSAGDLFERTRATGNSGRQQVRLFTDGDSGAKWAAGLVQPPEKVKRGPAKPQTKRLECDVVASGPIPAPLTVPAPQGRYEVRGPVPSVVSAAECRPWANLAAIARPAA